MRESKFKMTEVGLVPVDWEFTVLSDFCSFQNGYAFDSNNFCELGYNVIRISDIQEGKIDIDCCKKVQHIVPEQFEVKNGDILIAMSGATTGKVGLYSLTKTAYINQRVGNFVPKNDLNKLYLYYLLSSEYFTKYMFPILSASAQPNISGAQIMGMQFPFPPLPEQQRIAKALSDVDELISSLDALIEKKRDIKKGTMQQLLTGKKRLPGFTEPWVEKKLGEIVDIVKGEQLNRDRLNDGAKYPVYNGGISPSGFHNAYNTEGNTVIISEGGNSCGFVNYVKENFWRGGHCYALFNFTGSINFLYQLLKYYENSIMKLRAGSGLPNIQKNNLCSFVLEIPSKAEQTAIASILSSMDDEISALEAKRDKYISIKQGMMQELLTGKTRLI